MLWLRYLVFIAELELRNRLTSQLVKWNTNPQKISFCQNGVPPFGIVPLLSPPLLSQLSVCISKAMPH